MDRFIEAPELARSAGTKPLKSNMDRFIGFNMTLEQLHEKL